MPAAVRQAVRLEHGVVVRRVALEAVAHLDGRGQVLVAQLEQVGEVLARVLSAGREERDEAVLRLGDDRRREEARAIGEIEIASGDERRAALAGKLEDPHARVVVVQHVAVRAALDEFVVDRQDVVEPLVDDLPLRGRGHGDPKVSLHPLEAMERHAGAVVEYDDHARGAVVVLRSSCRLGQGRGVHLAASPAPQSLTVPAERHERHLAEDADRHRGLEEGEEPAARARRARLARVQVLMLDARGLAAGVGARAVPAMSLAPRLVCSTAARVVGRRRRRALGRRVGFVAGRCGVGRLRGPGGPVLAEHLRRLLAARLTEKVSKPSDGRSSRAGETRHLDEGLHDARHERVVPGGDLLPGALEHALDVREVDRHDHGRVGHALSIVAPSRCRYARVSG